MTIREFIVELKKLDPQMSVLGQSETSIWEIRAEDLVPTDNVTVDYYEFTKSFEKALILGYKH